MSQEDQEQIAYAEKYNDFNQPEYLAANDRFMLKHAGGIPNELSKEPLRRKKIAVSKLIYMLGDRMSFLQWEH